MKRIEHDSAYGNRKKTEKISIRCTKHEKDLIAKEAEELGISVSDYLLDKRIPERSSHRLADEQAMVLVKDMVKLQQNVNRFVWYAKQRIGIYDPELLLEIEKLERGEA